MYFDGFMLVVTCSARSAHRSGGKRVQGSRGRPGVLRLVPGWVATFAPSQLGVACD